MRRTYKSKKETAGAIDPRDVLLTLDAKSSVFDAFYIQNIKQTKRDMSVGSTMPFAASKKVRKRKYVKKLREDKTLHQPRESTSRTALLTPDKSFRVNKAPDLFDQLLNASSNRVETSEPVNLFRKQSAIQQRRYVKKKPEKNKFNYFNSDSSDSNKENFNSSEEPNKTVNTSDIKSHKLIIEKEAKSSPKYIDESINNIVNNLSIFTHIRNQTVETPKNEHNNLTKHAQQLQTSPLCSTPFLEKYRGASIYRISPISKNLNDSPKCVTVMEDSIDFDRDDLFMINERKNKINHYKINKKQNITEATIKENIEQSIVPEEKYECNDTFEIINKNNTTAASIVYDIIDETSKTETQPSILLIPTVNSNKKEPRELATYLSYIQTTEMEPFHGFEDIDLVGNNKPDSINNKYMVMENVLVDKSYTIPSLVRLSRDSTFMNINQNIVKDKNVECSESKTSSAAESSHSESFYDTCNSNDSIDKQVRNIEPIVIVERLNNSVFDNYYSQMANYSVENNYFNTSSNSNDYATVRISDRVSNKSSNNSIISEDSVENNNFNISIDDDLNNGSISSNEIDYNDDNIESKLEDVCVSFVTTRRRNEFRNDSFIGLNNSIVSASCCEFDKTILTNKNSLEFVNYVNIEEHIVDKKDDILNIEEIEVNKKEYKCSITESDEIYEAELSPKVKKILTRKNAKANNSKSPIHKKPPKIEDNSDGSFSIESEEIDQNETVYNFFNSESDEICEAELSPKVKKILTRKNAKANKSKSPIHKKPPKIEDNSDGSLSIESEEIDQNETAYNFFNSESDEICEAKLSPKVKKILTRKNAKANKSKSPIHKKPPKIEDNSDGSLSIESEEIDQNETAYNFFNSESDEICEAKLSPKVKKILTRKNAKANKSKSPIHKKPPKIEDNSEGSLSIESEEIDQNETVYNFFNSESDEICEAELSPKVKKILTRKNAKANKSKSPIHKKPPKIEDNSDGSLSIESEEIDQNETAYNFFNSESDEICETQLLPNTKKITRKSARESSKAKKSKSSLNNRVSNIKKNADNSININTRKSSRIYRDSIARDGQNCTGYEVNMGNSALACEQPGIILQPGKGWERSLSIYRRLTTITDHFDHSMLDEEQNKVRKYGQSVITALEMEDLKGSFHNDSINSRRSTFVSKPSRSTIKIVRESNTSRASLCSTIVCEDLEGFLGEDCDDTIVELSKLSIADSQHEVTIIEKFHDTSNRRTTARDYVLRRCNQADVLPFDECYPDPVLKNCRKIGEGVYGEVFLWRAGDGRARVLKVIPIAGNIKVNGEQQKDFHEVISEIVIAMELSALRAPIADIEQHLNEGKSLETLDLHSVENATDAFNEVLRVRCVSGSYPSRLLELWELYDECRGSENDSPAALPSHQQYIVLELDNAGQDLESFHFHNAEQSYALFKQIAFGLAVAEEAYQFEHRDLHWGNVLISPTEEKFASFVVRGRLHRVCRAGVRASVIDYSLSRATLGRCALYNDLATDEALFDALGDYQFQLYRLMRDKLGNDWKNFEPYTNILWLHYTVDKMITALRYTRTNTKIHKHYIAKLKEIKNRILDYGSAVQYVLTDNEL